MDKLKSWCWNSLTVGWSYVLLGVGALLELAPPLLDLLGAPEIAEPLRGLIPAEWLGVYTMVVGVVTFLARMRSVRG